MRVRHPNKASIALLSATLVLMLLPDVSLAARGGNGGGKPGGGDDPPPSLPVTYDATIVNLPGQSALLYNHNEAGAMVGTLHDSPAGGRRGLAYLPGVFSDAVYLDDPAFGLQGTPEGWNTRSAADINNHGTIVGNIDRDAEPNTDIRPMYITGATTGTPTLHTFDSPFNSLAWHEVVAGINDSGDMVVWSQERLADESVADTLYVGNPGLYGKPSTAFTRLDFTSAGITTPNISNTTILISERQGDGSVFVTGGMNTDSGDFPFRARVDNVGSDVELGTPYVQADGSEVEWRYSFNVDATDSGDVVGAAIIRPSKKGKVKQNGFAALWAAGSQEFVSPIGEQPLQAEFHSGVTNNTEDFLLHTTAGAGPMLLWDADWSPANGPIAIEDLIASDDDARAVLDFAFDGNWELTDSPSGGWPTILGQEWTTLSTGERQAYWAFFTPQGEGSLAATSAVPEPQAATLVACSMLTVLLGYRHRRGS